jgi:uncharacterized protein YvpB
MTIFSLFAATVPSSSVLSVPYVSQVPDGAWVAPWDEACEEASIVMVENYYSKREDKTAEQQKAHLQPMIDWENKEFKTYEDTDAEQTLALIRYEAAFNAKVVRSPSLDSIKAELAANRPVIALVSMYELYGEQNMGDSYHVLVLTGYDDDKKEFIVNDPARDRKTYSYDAVMSALHDYNSKSHEADGTPTVLFTQKRWFNPLTFIYKNVSTFLQTLFQSKKS